MMTEWKLSKAPVAYDEALAAMKSRAGAFAKSRAEELVWLLEHPALYTAGTSAVAEDLLDPAGLPVIETRRGGRHTYHGPGQRVVYLVLDVEARGRDVRKFVWSLEEWTIRALAELGVRGEHRPGRPGVWVVSEGREFKIMALGLRIRNWIATHGIAINVNPDLSRFRGVVPCGIHEHGVTSLQALGIEAGVGELDAALRQHFPAILGNDRSGLACNDKGAAISLSDMENLEIPYG